MPGNIYHYFIRDLQKELPKGDNKNKEENIKDLDIDFDKIWHDKYDIKPKLTMNERVVKVCKALSNDFDFDLFY